MNKELGYLLGLSIFILTLWYITYKEREYCDNQKGVFIENFFGGKCELNNSLTK